MQKLRKRERGMDEMRSSREGAMRRFIPPWEARVGGVEVKERVVMVGRVVDAASRCGRLVDSESRVSNR